jgi:hypothetical protein
MADAKAGLARCYAANLGGCKPPISSEHFISRGILEQIGPKILIDGLPWAGKQVALPATSLGSNVLCKHHNSLLSDVDVEAASMFRCAKDVREGKRFGEILLDGDKIERWSLKVLSGLLASGNTRRADGTSTKGFAPPANWNRVLFGQVPMPADCGLHFFEQPQSDGKQELAVTINSHAEDNRIYGITVQMMGLNLHLCLQKLVWERPEKCILRPRAIYFPTIGSTMRFSWADGGTQTIISLGRPA